MSRSEEQEEIEEEPSAPPPKSGPLVRPIYIVVLLLLVLGGGGFAMTGPVCNTKEPGRDVKDLTQQEIIEQAVNRLKDLHTVVAFGNATHVLSKPVPVNPMSLGLTVNSVLAVKRSGDRSDVVTHHTGKGFIAYKLRLPDGACGYVFSTDPIQISSQ
jgi:hypothetical protein